MMFVSVAIKNSSIKDLGVELSYARINNIAPSFVNDKNKRRY